MKNVTISVLAFNVQNKENEMVDLNKIGGKGIAQVFSEYMDDIKEKFEAIPHKEKVYKSELYEVDDIKDHTGRDNYTFMFGKIKTGSYGLPSEIVDHETGKVTHNKTDKEAEVLPFYFCMAVPASGTEGVYKGILIIQTIGVFSMRSTFETSFGRKIKNIDPSLKLIVGHLAPVSYIKNFLDNGILESIVLTKYKRYDDPATRVENPFNWESKELTIKKPSGFIAKRRSAVERFLKGSTKLSSVIEVNDFDFDYDVAKFDFKLGGKTKRINLSNLEKLMITEDITEKILLEGEWPSSESMKMAMMEIAEDYMAEIGIA